MPQNLNLKKTRDTLDKVLAQAKDSMKVLDALQKEGLSRARAIIEQMPAREVAQKLANERVVTSLRKLGLATRSEVTDLERRVEELASELRAQINQVQKSARKSAKKDKDDAASSDANA